MKRDSSKLIFQRKRLLLSCTKNVHFEFNGETFPATVLPWAPPLGPVIAGIFMVELENTLVSRLKNYLLFWKRYVDDTLCFVKKGSRDYILPDFHDNITFTFEEERNNMISFLDVLLIHKQDGIDLAVFHKEHAGKDHSSHVKTHSGIRTFRQHISKFKSRK